MALKRVLKHTDVRSLVFDKTRLQVQVHNLPIGSFFMVIVKDIASIVGVVDESETDEGMERDAIFYESESLPTRQFCYAEVERLIEGTVW